MPVRFEYTADKGFIIAHVSSPLTIEDLRTGLVEITKQQIFPVNTPIIWDIRNMNLAGIEREFGQQLINLRRQHPDRHAAKSAILVNSDHAFGMARIYEMLSEDLPTEFMVFRDPRAAEAWVTG